MRQKTILPLGAAFCLSFASLASGQETAPERAASVPPDKVALHAAEQARVKLQNQVNAEKGRIINRVGRLPQNQRKKALINEVKNSLILQQARDSEGGENQAQGLRKPNPEMAAMSEIIARINSLPAAERKHALRQAMKAHKGKKLENVQN
ncbi:hypothetical protein L0337_22470 [candidate division KSB1 bacterium]|nr:hypothetical protein [candidate division KSB1 bacterium]